MARAVKRPRNESIGDNSEEADLAVITEDISSDNEETDYIDLTCDDTPSPGPSNSASVPGVYERKIGERVESQKTIQIDESISIVYEKIRPTPDLNVELNKASNVLVVDFFKKDCTPYYGHFSKKIRIQKKKLKLSVSVSIGDQSANNQTNTEETEPQPGPSQPSEPSSEAASNHRYTIQCGICLDNLEEILGSDRNLWSTTCGHVFCNVCVSRCQGNFKQCPTCCKKLTKKQYHPIYH